MIHIVRGIMNHKRCRRPSAFLLLTVSVALGATAVAALDSGGEGAPVLLIGIREYVLPLGGLALAALIGAVLLGLPKASSLRTPLVTMLLVIGAPTLLLGGLASAMSGGPDEEVRTEQAPGRGDRRLLVVARSGSLEPVQCVYADQGNPPRERRWSVGCFNGDSEENALGTTEWTASDRIRMTTRGGAVHEVTLAPDGRPDRVVSVG
ncbi:hypothetical protein [Streptomyces sp. WAC08241]|uniref:hypothetical protein n=1 Tax=Streptomyces sp. WAC08241 TaxID=2487421 RepID=UPI000F782499|nr:hypothetical protein [Streptomyces sp. WAC08241]RSS43423.1 hypothetical protein EF906_09755 [Streptomyces sp. WAC08241]